MKEIQTNGKTILFMEVPEDAKLFKILSNTILFPNCIGMEIDLPSGQYQILGKSTELSEEQKKEICEQVSSFGKMYWKDYRSENSFCDGFTVQESYLSLLEANGIVDRNNASHPSDIEPTNRAYYDKIEQAWQEAQSKVKHYLVLKRI